MTIAEICELAQANIAAVSYYFDDKAGLYKAAWEHAYQRAVEAMPYDDPDVDGPADERLFRNIRSLVYRMGGGGPALELQNLIAQEHSSPTGLVKEIGPSLFQRPMRHLRGAIAAILPDASDATIDYCVFSVMAQCRALLPANRRFSRVVPTRPTRARLDEIARHITEFSKGGFAALAGAEASEPRRPAARHDGNARPAPEESVSGGAP